jgi:acetyl esterase/lipase
MHLVDLPDGVREEARTFNAALEELLATRPATHEVEPAETRRQRASGEGIFGPVVHSESAVDRSYEFQGGMVQLRIFATERPTGAYLHIHGGGFTLGSADQQDTMLEETVKRTGMTVLSVEYRLAPEHPYPAGPDDCERAALWLVSEGAAEFGVTRLLIGGESAGANLSATTLLRLRDRHGITGAFVGANLTFGGFDLGGTPSLRNWGERNLVINTPMCWWFNQQYLPGADVAAYQDPQMSPLFADLHDMPPALFSVGSLDPLIDDSLFMAARWEAAGAEAQLDVYPEGPHAFTVFPTKLADMARSAQYDFLNRMLDGPPSRLGQ